jgi:hypothetical protein
VLLLREISPFNLKEFILVGVSIFLKSFNNFGDVVDVVTVNFSSRIFNLY